jgi:disulfide bond formation protein DsbB
MSFFFASLTVMAMAIFLGCAGILVWSRLSDGGQGWLDRLTYSVENNGLFLAWAIATVATLGSLYYSEIANFTPCKLCWFQRIAMYPQAVILGIAVFYNDRKIRRYVLPVVSIGALISIYHYLLERFPSWASEGSCDPTVPCTTVWVWKFHFISIPFMALAGFAAIGTLVWLLPKDQEEERDEHDSPSQ